MVTVDTIREWLNSDRAEGCSHMVVVCDTFDYNDFPIYVKGGESIQDLIKAVNPNNDSFLKIMEIYNLSKNIENQLSEGRSWNI